MPPESPKSDRYDAREAEARWQKIWDERDIADRLRRQIRPINNRTTRIIKTTPIMPMPP